MVRASRKRVKPRKFQKGDLVLRALRGLISDPRGKFKPSWSGPYVIRDLTREGVTWLTNLDENQFLEPDNVDQLKKFYTWDHGRRMGGHCFEQLYPFYVSIYWYIQLLAHWASHGTLRPFRSLSLAYIFSPGLGASYCALCSYFLDRGVLWAHCVIVRLFLL